MSRKSAFQQQDNLIEHFLYRRHYSSKYIQIYLQTSLLSKIRLNSCQNFFDLAGAVRQLSIHLPQWEAGPAKAMLENHASKLWDIHQYAIRRKQLILRVYIYLRDAQAKEFHDEPMVGAHWERLNDLNSANFSL
jgi:sRNA-binding regulator protein Hfq